MRILIKDGHVIDPANKIDDVYDIFIENGIIEEVGKNLDYDGVDIEQIDAKGKIVAPGLVDMHCHLRDPGQQYKEDIETGTKSAAAGGVTSIACMPNTQPVIDDVTIVEYIKSKAANVGCVNVFPIGAITKGSLGQELAEIGKLKFAGVAGISDDGKPVTNPAIMKNALNYAKTFDTMVISHCEVPELSEGGAINEGTVSTKLGLQGINAAAEDIAVCRDIILAKAVNAPIHIAHVSTAGAAELIRRAKKDGVQITCETCPHYFSLTEDAVIGYNTNAKMNPPLRTEQDVEAIIQAITDGTIDAIATDHAPHHIDEKNCEFDRALNGIVGFETALSLGITYLVEPNHISMSTLIEKMSYMPSRILGINKGTLSSGKSADIVIIDKDEKRTVNVDEFHSKSKNSPYKGYTLDGTVIYTIVGGKIVVRNGILV
ncbi:MAG: dihydroorotase [Clostridiaceae bacterium]|nr:dihydroorotase [Clostridiaceae bacterium]